MASTSTCFNMAGISTVLALAAGALSVRAHLTESDAMAAPSKSHRALSRSGGGSCQTSADCWLNGDCNGKVCDCDASWDGDNCELLAELPSIQTWPNPAFPLPNNLSTLASSWDSTMAQDADGTWHAYFNVVCSNFTWMHVEGAVIVHAISSAREGPYVFSDIALPQQSFDPHLKIVSDSGGSQTWILAHQRSGADPKPTPICTGDYAGTPVLHPWEATHHTSASLRAHNLSWPGPPSLASSASPYGPWTYHDINLPLAPTWGAGNWNPSLLPLGTDTDPVLLAWTAVCPQSLIQGGYASTVTVAACDTWKGPNYTLAANGLNGGMTPFNVSSEDPFLWRSSRGYHIVFHRMAWNNTWEPGSGGYAISTDGVNWTALSTPIYTTDIVLGGVPITMRRRERPEMQFDVDPSTGEARIVGLLTGVERIVDVLGQPSLSIYTPVRTVKPSRGGTGGKQ